jgi:hypothetical protein
VLWIACEDCGVQIKKVEERKEIQHIVDNSEHNGQKQGKTRSGI